MRAVFFFWDSSQHLANWCPFESSGSPCSMAPTLSWQRGLLPNKTTPILLVSVFKTTSTSQRHSPNPNAHGSFSHIHGEAVFPCSPRTASPSARALAFPQAHRGSDHAQQSPPCSGLLGPHVPDTQGTGFGENKPVPSSTKSSVCMLSLFRSQMCLLASGPPHRPM